MSPSQPTIYPFLVYDDASAALRWLAEAFGFEEHQVVRDPDGAVVHAELKLGNGMVMLGTARKDSPMRMKSARVLGGTSAGVYLVVTDPDTLYARAVRAGAHVLRPLADTDYGSRDFVVRDPEGNVWSFGTYQPFREG